MVTAKNHKKIGLNLTNDAIMQQFAFLHNSAKIQLNAIHQNWTYP